MEIRAAIKSDSEAISALLDSLGYTGNDSFLPGRIEQLISHPDEELLVVVDERQVKAVISVHFIPQLALAGDFARISYFCVADKARGQGIGAQLDEYVTELARRKGVDRIEVHCSSRRTDAHRFYFRQGYEESPKYLLKML